MTSYIDEYSNSREVDIKGVLLAFLRSMAVLTTTSVDPQSHFME